MLISHVHITVKEEFIDEFVEATIENAKHSILEPGIAKFELIQSDVEPDVFVLAEAYYSAADQAKHKDTPHFKTWVDAVEHMMALPRQANRFNSLFPDEIGLTTPL